MATQTEGVHRVCGSGRSFWGPGDKYTFLITGEESNGRFFVMEGLVPPGGGPPPHVHAREDETLYILGGECIVGIGADRLAASEGDFVYLPRGTVHYFRNEGEEPMKMILTFSPPGIEKFFEEVFEPVRDPSAPPPPVTKDLLDCLLAAGDRYGLQFVLPGAR